MKKIDIVAMKKIDIDITTNINGIHLKSCIINASGALCNTENELLNLFNSSSGAVVTKSCTKKYREGNSIPRYFAWNFGSINSMGLPNFGIDFYLKFLETIKNKNYCKPVFLSISGLSVSENYYLIKKANLSSNVSALEINLSCPNIGNKKILNVNFLSKFLKKIFEFNNKPLGLKFPPFFDKKIIKSISSILNQFPISFVTSINSVPNGMFLDSVKESTVIQPNNGCGGIGGIIIKPFALFNIHQFYSYLNKKIAIIGCGGISCGKDVFDHILCGATAVQVGTQFIIEGPSIFDRLKKEFIEFLQKRKYYKLTQFRGKLKYCQ